MDSVFIVGPEINFLSDFGKKENSMVLVNISKEIKLNFVDGLLEKRIKYLLMKIIIEMLYIIYILQNLINMN